MEACKQHVRNPNNLIPTWYYLIQFSLHTTVTMKEAVSHLDVFWKVTSGKCFLIPQENLWSLFR